MSTFIAERVDPKLSSSSVGYAFINFVDVSKPISSVNQNKADLAM